MLGNPGQLPLERLLLGKVLLQEDDLSWRDAAVAVLVEQGEEIEEDSLLAFTFRRLGVPFFLVLSSMLFPSINSVLTLITGSICGVLLLTLPPMFYLSARK